MSIRSIAKKRNRAFGPAIDNLEGRQLMSVAHGVVPGPSAPAVVHLQHHVPMAGQRHGHHAPIHQPVHHVQHTKNAEVPSATNSVKHTWPNEPGIVGFNGKLYRATNENGYFQIQYLPDSSKPWTDVTKVAGKSDFAPTLATFNGKLYLAWTSSTAQHPLYIESSADGVNWSHPVALETASGAPALAAAGDRLYMAWAGTDADNHLNMMYSSDGVHWGNKVTLAETTNPGAGPALAVNNSQMIEIAWAGRGKTSELNVASTFDGFHFTKVITLPETTTSGSTSTYAVGPSLTNVDGTFVLAWVGTNGHLNTAASADGISFTQKVTYSQKAKAGTGPRLTTLGGKAYLAFTRPDSQYETLDVIY